MKSAQLNLVVNLAKQYARHGVTVNNLAPGMIATDATAPQLAQEATRAALLDEIPARSIGQPADCVGPVVMLCSEAGRYVTGVDLFVDGGMHLPGRAAFIGADGRLRPS
jgi:NAD(P)-dependent dehydrogenase (short-subunit alcohol dehydrogenase family)